MTADPATLELAAKVADTAADTLDLESLLDAAERDFEWRDRIGTRGELYLWHLSDYADIFKQHVPHWDAISSPEASLVQRIERLRLDRTHRAETDDFTITVSELAASIGRTDGTTRALLDRGLIPGAARKTPGVKNSPWLIPATSPDRFLEGRS